MKYFFIYLLAAFTCCLLSCKKNNSSTSPESFSVSFSVNGISNGTSNYTNLNATPVVQFSFSAPVQQSGINSNFSLVDNSNNAVAFSVSLQNQDSVVVIQPANSLNGFSKYVLSVSSNLMSSSKGNLINPVSINLTTGIDSSDKFPQISDSALLTLVEDQTFKYFWNLGDPTSGLARERYSSATTVTTGGSGFGIMALLVGVQRNFITRAQALSRIDTIVNFLTNKATRYHGAFPHWMNGQTGATIPFGTQDNGGDIVETSYMMQGLLCARQFFNSQTDVNEINLRDNINNLYDGVEWNWYRQSGQNVLTWNWSPDYGWAINVQVRGWDEALITYVLAASSNIDSNSIPKIVYDEGWAGNGGIKNGNSFYGILLPLGPDYGGPLFFAHYSFLGINPNNLSDAYANYWSQNVAHSQINYNYCVNNPKKYYGYSNRCWGLTASDIPGGYTASSPTNDAGVIAPTAAISSLPYTPAESMNALRFFYYKLGDKIWKDYGFIDAFKLNNIWFDNDFLAIDQGPEIVMIENYRSGLLWNLFMSCPEIKNGMKKLGFASPNL
jgi:hypothetical protein